MRVTAEIDANGKPVLLVTDGKKGYRISLVSLEPEFTLPDADDTVAVPRTFTPIMRAELARLEDALNHRGLASLVLSDVALLLFYQILRATDAPTLSFTGAAWNAYDRLRWNKPEQTGVESSRDYQWLHATAIAWGALKQRLANS